MYLYIVVIVEYTRNHSGDVLIKISNNPNLWNDLMLNVLKVFSNK